MAAVSLLAQFWRLSWVGVHKEGDTMAAHAWTSCGNEKVVGGAGAERFTPLTAFGPRS